jgi:sarcosine oxidase subunit alpha
VLLVERDPRVGGRLRCRLEPEGGPDLAWADRVAARVAGAGGEVATDTTVLGLWHDGGAPLAVLHAEGAPARVRLVRPRTILTCTGATPQPLAIPGSDRPGVFGARGLAVALAEHGVLPGEHVVVVPDGGEARAFGAALQRAGVKVAVGVDPTGGRVLGRGRVRGLRGPSGILPCDTIAVTALAPATELARALGAEVRWDGTLGAFAVVAGADGRTAVPGLLAAGEATGTSGGAELAADAGRRAGETARG